MIQLVPARTARSQAVTSWVTRTLNGTSAAAISASHSSVTWPAHTLTPPRAAARSGEGSVWKMRNVGSPGLAARKPAMRSSLNEIADTRSAMSNSAIEVRDPALTLLGDDLQVEHHRGPRMVTHERERPAQVGDALTVVGAQPAELAGGLLRDGSVAVRGARQPDVVHQHDLAVRSGAQVDLRTGAEGGCLPHRTQGVLGDAARGDPPVGDVGHRLAARSPPQLPAPMLPARPATHPSLRPPPAPRHLASRSPCLPVRPSDPGLRITDAAGPGRPLRSPFPAGTRPRHPSRAAAARRRAGSRRRPRS